MQWQQDGFWNRDTNFYSKCIIEEFLIGTPPERVVDNGCTRNGGIFNKSTVKCYILGNPVNYHDLPSAFALFYLIN